MGFIIQGSERCCLTPKYTDRFSVKVGKTVQLLQPLHEDGQEIAWNIEILENLDTAFGDDKLQEVNLMFIWFDLVTVLKEGDEVLLRHGRYAQAETPRVSGSIIILGYCLCGWLHILPEFMCVCSWFSGFIQPPKNMPVDKIKDKLNTSVKKCVTVCKHGTPDGQALFPHHTQCFGDSLWIYHDLDKGSSI